jgi:hypothetical protein
LPLSSVSTQTQNLKDKRQDVCLSFVLSCEA